MDKVEVQIDYSADKNIKQVLINGERVPRVKDVKINLSLDEPPSVVLKIIPDFINSKIDCPR